MMNMLSDNKYENKKLAFAFAFVIHLAKTLDPDISFVPAHAAECILAFSRQNLAGHSGPRKQRPKNVGRKAPKTEPFS